MRTCLRRREFITLLGGAAAWPLAARAQQGDRVRRIGVLIQGNENDPEMKLRYSAFTHALADSGWTDDSWMGHSMGRWEGESLVVDVTALQEDTWFDRPGNYHSDALRVVERYTPRSTDVLNYEATITDPKVFSRPWKISMPLYRRLERNAQVLEFKCVEFVEEIMYGHLRKQSSSERTAKQVKRRFI